MVIFYIIQFASIDFFRYLVYDIQSIYFKMDEILDNNAL